MRKIDGKEKTLRELLQNQQYTIQYYQREYRWGTKQILELLSDLTDEFLSYYSENDERKAVKNYGYYYLGSIIRTNNNAGNAIIDGQQRLTSITLLLIYINNLQKEREDKVNIENLIYSETYGEKSFNLSVPEREECLNALFNNQNFDISNQNDSIKNIYNRYQDIKNNLSDDIIGKALPYFTDWLINNVYFVEIVATTEQDAHKIFVTMNDRGLSLTPAEMLKGYILSEIELDETRDKANQKWKEVIQSINDLSDDNKTLSEDFFKNWFRAQYAESIRENKKGAKPEDFDLIGTEFHKWVRDNHEKLGLASKKDYSQFTLKTLPTFANIYITLKKASTELNKNYPEVFYNASRDFTFQYQLILASIDADDTQEIISQKIKIVSKFIDIYITQRVVNYKTVNYSTIKNAVFNISKKIRRQSIDSLKSILTNELINLEYQLNTFKDFALNNFTNRYIRHMLARMTNYIEECCDVPQTSFEKYIDRNRTNGYDIEHIIPDNYEMVKDYFDNEKDFYDTRNNLGNLILLPADKNRSIQDLPYTEKLKTYAGDNILAKSLCDGFYANNPRFKQWCAEENINFQPIKEFTKISIFERQKIYEQLVNKLWNIELINQI